MSKAHYNSCKNWEYKGHPNAGKLRVRSEALIEAIRLRPRLARRDGFDTRRAHGFLFDGLSPRDCPHFAGQYRGYLNCRFLRHYTVGIGQSDPLVGLPYPPNLVEQATKQLEQSLAQTEAAFEAWRNAPAPKPDESIVVARLVAAACNGLERFLTIHPYANGNGHCGRLLAWALFARQGYLPLGLPLDERPPYNQALYEHRRGNTLYLQVVMLQALKGYSPPQTPPIP